MFALITDKSVAKCLHMQGEGRAKKLKEFQSNAFRTRKEWVHEFIKGRLEVKEAEVPFYQHVTLGLETFENLRCASQMFLGGES